MRPSNEKNIPFTSDLSQRIQNSEL